PPLVEGEHDHARLPVPPGADGVVEDADEPAAVEEAGVVLPRERRAPAEPEVAPRPAEAPHHAPVAAADLVDGPRVARRDEQVAVGRDVDGVDVEVVVRALDGAARLREVDVVEAPPLEEQPPARHLELLDDAAHDDAAGAAAGAREA